MPANKDKIAHVHPAPLVNMNNMNSANVNNEPEMPWPPRYIEVEIDNNDNDISAAITAISG